jgi:SAM-dependent methyltransferase
MGIRENPNTPVYQCGHCTLQYIDPPYPDLRSYYQNTYRQNGSDYVPGTTLTPEERFPIQQTANLATSKHFKEEIPTGGSVLEIGCSAGGFLSHIQDAYEVYGAEWNPSDAAFVRETGEIPCEEGELADIYPNKTFTAIVALDVLEHQIDPVNFLRQCREKLIGGGYLWLETPSIGNILLSGYDSPAFANRWYREAHVTYWNLHLLASTLATMGFEARVSFRQTYGLLNHTNWELNGTPMEDPIRARKIYQPIPRDRQHAMTMNRMLADMDKLYRVQMETLQCADTLVAIARRQQI